MNLQLLARKPVRSEEQLPLVNQATRDSLMARFHCHGIDVRGLSREFGLREGDVAEIIRQESVKREERQYKRGLRAAWTFHPLPPAGGRIVPRRVEVVDARARKVAA